MPYFQAFLRDFKGDVQPQPELLQAAQGSGVECGHLSAFKKHQPCRICDTLVAGLPSCFADQVLELGHAEHFWCKAGVLDQNGTGE